MRTQEQAFRAYYASMTDSDLLAVARNRRSFIPLAQTQMMEELRKRGLEVPSEASSPDTENPTVWTRLQKRLHREAAGSQQIAPPLEPLQIAPPEPAQIVPPLEPQHPIPRAAAASASAGALRPRISHAGATEDQVSMAATVPERINRHGGKIEDLAGTGQHDSLGG